MITLSKKTLHHQECRRAGFTLVEILIGLAIAVVLMASVMLVVISIAKISVKNERLNALATEARQTQELITQELSSAINIYDKDVNLLNRPVFADGNGDTSQSYRQITYRAPVGPPGNLTGNVSSSASSVTFYARSALKPEVGDYFVLDSPKLGRGIQITAVSDSRTPDGDGDVTVTLATTLAGGTVTGYDITDAKLNSRVEIQRSRSFVVAAPIAGASTTTLRWIENTNSASPARTLSSDVDANQTYLFKQVPDLATAKETSISWYLVLKDQRSANSLPGSSVFFTSSSVGGATSGSSTSLIMPKSGNSLALSNPFAAVSTSISTTTTSTTSSTTSTTSTTSLSTTTTSKSTTKSTTSASTTKTTSKSTTKTTSKSTTSASTTKATSKSTTKTTSKSTTSKSTTKATSTPTTSATTTKSTTKSTTSATTTKSTTKSSTSSKASTSSTIPFDG